MEEYSGLSLQPHKAIVGTNVLAHASGIHDQVCLLIQGEKSLLIQTLIYLNGDPRLQFVSDGNIESLVSKHQQSGLAWKLVDIQVLFMPVKKNGYKYKGWCIDITVG